MTGDVFGSMAGMVDAPTAAASVEMAGQFTLGDQDSEPLQGYRGGVAEGDGESSSEWSCQGDEEDTEANTSQSINPARVDAVWVSRGWWQG